MAANPQHVTRKLWDGQIECEYGQGGSARTVLRYHTPQRRSPLALNSGAAFTRTPAEQITRTFSGQPSSGVAIGIG
jgi:hypothetical protein